MGIFKKTQLESHQNLLLLFVLFKRNQFEISSTCEMKTCTYCMLEIAPYSSAQYFSSWFVSWHVAFFRFQLKETHLWTREQYLRCRHHRCCVDATSSYYLDVAYYCMAPTVLSWQQNLHSNIVQQLIANSWFLIKGPVRVLIVVSFIIQNKVRVFFIYSMCHLECHNLPFSQSLLLWLLVTSCIAHSISNFMH